MISFKVEGMSCGACARSLTNAVQKMDPAALVTVDLASKKVEVTSQAPAEQIRSAIETAGYEARLEVA